MLAHQERVVTEKRELDTKIEALSRFFKSPTYAELTTEERTLLQRQLAVMQNYSSILTDRIAIF